MISGNEIIFNSEVKDTIRAILPHIFPFTFSKRDKAIVWKSVINEYFPRYKPFPHKNITEQKVFQKYLEYLGDIHHGKIKREKLYVVDTKEKMDDFIRELGLFATDLVSTKRWWLDDYFKIWRNNKKQPLSWKHVLSLHMGEIKTEFNTRWKQFTRWEQGKGKSPKHYEI